MNIIQKFITNNDCYKTNISRADSRYRTFQDKGPQGLMLHSVGCAQPSALVFANLWNKPNYQVAVHAAIQADGTCYQCLPWNYRGWHAGASANNTHIGVEMTEPASLKYGNGGKFTCSDIPGAQVFVKQTYNQAVLLFAKLCRDWKLDPLKQGVIISHKEGHALGVASNHGDPEHLWKGLTLPFTMDTFRAAVKAEIEHQLAGSVPTQPSEPAQPAEPPTPIEQPDTGEIKEGSVVLIKEAADRYHPNGSKIPDWVKKDYKHVVTKLTVNGKPVIKGGKDCGLLGKKIRRKDSAISSGINTWAALDNLVLAEEEQPTE